MFESISVSLSQVEYLPQELRLFRSGVNKSRKGEFLFDVDAALAVMAAYRRHGVERLPFDYEHKSLDPVAHESEQKAAGWFTLDVRNDELWAVNIEWTDRAKAELLARERLYISPAFRVDAKGRVIELINVALTNLPALDDQKQLIAAKAVPFKAYPARDSEPWDADAAKARVKAMVGDDVEKYREAFAWYDAEKPELLGSYKLPHHDVVDGKMVTSRAGVIAAAGALSGARGGVDIPDTDLPGVRSHLAQHYKQFDMSPPWEREERMKNSLIVALSLKDDAAEADVMAAVATLKQTQSELLSLTGAETAEAAVGVIRAWQGSHAEVETLKQKLSELETAAIETERAALLKANAAKFTPAELDGWVKAANLETLNAYVQTAPDRVVLSQTDLPQPPKPDAQTLTDHDRHVAARMGLSIDDYSKAKAELLEGDK